MKINKKLFFKSDENINSFYLMAKFAISSHVEFFYSDIIDNTFLFELETDENYNKELQKYIDLYVYSKKVYNVLKRFFFKIKLKKTKKYRMTTDLYFNDLSLFPEEQKIDILENNTIYTFRLTDLINIWTDCLLEIEGLFPIPKDIKNPYTNIKFNTNNLYNIYFKILNSNFHIPIIITHFFESQFKIHYLLDYYYPYLKDKCILKFCKECSDYEKYEYIENMFFDYRSDISWTRVPTIRVLKYDGIKIYCRKLNICVKYYLIGKYSPNNWTKEKYYNLGKTVIKKFIENNIHLIIKSTYQHSSTLRNRIRRNRSLTPFNTTPPPPPSTPPPSTPPPSIPPQSIPLPPYNNLQSNVNIYSSSTQTNTIVESYDTGRESINRLIEEIDLGLLNSSAVSPFSPSYQLPRTPNRI